MRTEQVNITQITRYTKDKEGKPLKGNYGLYKKVNIKTHEYEDRWISGFAKVDGHPTDSWEVGNRVEIIIEERNGYLNFRLPKRDDVINDKLGELELRVKALEQWRDERRNEH